VLELARVEVSVVLCTAAPEAVDAICDVGPAFRVAPDEILLLVPPGSAANVVRDTTERVEALDEDAVVLDASDGWSAWSLEGDDVRNAFARLSELELPADGAVQGKVAHVPVKMIARADGLWLLVPAMWDGHLRERILGDLATLGVTERPEPETWSQPERARRSQA
jgi:hypothetical protein